MSFFDLLASLERDADDFRVTIPGEWGQGRSIFAGLQSALALRAMRARVPATLPLRTLQTTFVGPAPAGPVRVLAAVLRSGKSATQVECRLLDGDHVILLAVGIFGAPRSSAIAVRPSA